MAKKPAPTKAHEPKPDRFSNPLVTDPPIHADLKPLFDAVVMVWVWSDEIARCYPKLLQLKETRGLPNAEEWPDSPELERAKALHSEWANAERDEYARRGEDVSIAGFCEPLWTKAMREWSGYYRDWCDAIATAKETAKSPAVAAIMDAGEARPAHRWTTQTIIDLDNLAGTLHPVGIGGFDGLGFIQHGLPPLPMDFPARADAVWKRIAELRSIPVSAVPPPPNSPPIDSALLASPPGPARTEVVLWEGAALTEHNIRLARTRSAYLEAHGNVPAALAALEATENKVSRSTFYNHLDALDKEIPRWRESVQLSNPTGYLDGMRKVGTRGKSRGKVR